MKILITGNIPSVAEEILKQKGFEVIAHKSAKPINRNVLIKKSKNVDAIISLLTEKFDEEVIDQLKNCKIIANYAVGFNNIDVEYANKKGIVVTNTPDVLTDATAEIAVALILSCARRITEAERFIRSGKFSGWQPKLFRGIELKNKILGIVGAGRIGQATAERMRAFGCKIIYYNKSRKDSFEKGFGAKKVSLNTLMKKADIISLHLPLNKSTKLLITEEKLELMKPSAIIVNTARGEVIDEKYLIKMLKKKRIFSAGFDVYKNEPEINPELFKLENVVLLPHIGSATFETRDKMAILAANNVVNVLLGKKAKTPVINY